MCVCVGGGAISYRPYSVRGGRYLVREEGLCVYKSRVLEQFNELTTILQFVFV